MQLAGSAKRVILDASVLRRFSEGNQLHTLMGFLKRAAITDAVRDELARVVGSSIPGTQELTLILWHTEWPTPITTPQDLWPAVLRIKTEFDETDDPPSKHLGEITTVLVAAETKMDLAVIDDRRGRGLARVHSVPAISSAMLAAEMVARGILTTVEGFAVYDAATPAHVGTSEFADAIERVREALRSTG